MAHFDVIRQGHAYLGLIKPNTENEKKKKNPSPIGPKSLDRGSGGVKGAVGGKSNSADAWEQHKYLIGIFSLCGL